MAVDLINPFKVVGEVYGLVDGRNPEVVMYVGCSITGARARVRQHITGSSNGLCRDWVKEVGKNLRYVVHKDGYGNRCPGRVGYRVF